jgi:Tfp pilus assembly protein PilF
MTDGVTVSRFCSLRYCALWCGGIGSAQPRAFCLSEAVAQDKPKKDTRETRRTPALRNKVYERLAEAQTLAEAKDYAGASAILNDMISEDGKQGAEQLRAG